MYRADVEVRMVRVGVRDGDWVRVRARTEVRVRSGVGVGGSPP